MSGLVRDVSDFMTPDECALSPEEGIRKYNKRLAGIYLDEIPVGGLPMNMEEFHLFDPEHRSSYPLDIAYKAAEIVDPKCSEEFLFALRRATILEGRQTTKTDELAEVAEFSGIDRQKFLDCYQNGKAGAAFQEDLKMAGKYRIHSLPSYLIRGKKKEILVSGMPDFGELQALINKIK